MTWVPSTDAGRRTWLAVVLCGLVVLSGCQGTSQLFGDSAAVTDTEPTPTSVPTDSNETETQTSTPTRTNTPTDTPVPTDAGDPGGPFDTPLFRQAFRADVADARETRGLTPLSTSPDRRDVADTVARELAQVRYFENTTAQNSSQFDVTRRLARNGLVCARTLEDGRSVGGAFFLKGFYQRYIETGGQIRYYQTEQELSRSMTDRLLSPNSSAEARKLGETAYSPVATNQSVGVYRTPDDTVYVVYVVC